MNRREALTIIGPGVAFLASPKALPLFAISKNPFEKLEDAYEISGPMEAFIQPGFEAPTYGEDGKISGCIRIVKVDEASHTIWLENCANG